MTRTGHGFLGGRGSTEYLDSHSKRASEMAGFPATTAATPTLERNKQQGGGFRRLGGDDRNRADHERPRHSTLRGEGRTPVGFSTALLYWPFRLSLIMDVMLTITPRGPGLGLKSQLLAFRARRAWAILLSFRHSPASYAVPPKGLAHFSALERRRPPLAGTGCSRGGLH